MPRLRILSDLHREFTPFHPDEVDADVVVLAGDIDHGARGLEWAARTFPDTPVVYVAGNHEYYGEAIPRLTQKLRAHAGRLGIHFLEQDAVEVGGVRFLGCTLWTDFALFGNDTASAMAQVRQLADYRTIRVSPEFRRLRPEDTVDWHRSAVRWLQSTLSPSGSPTVVVTHHAPSLQSVAPWHRDDPVSAGFASSLDRLIEDRRPALWIHGHTHYSVDYRLGATRVLSNQRGYEGEAGTGWREAMVVELGAGA